MGDEQVKSVAFMLPHKKINNRSDDSVQVGMRLQVRDVRIESGQSEGKMSPSDLNEQSVLVRKVLVQRADGDPRLQGNLIRRGRPVADVVENPDGRLYDPINRPR